MDGIVERLVRFAGKVCISTDTEVEAAATIEALRAENTRLIKFTESLKEMVISLRDINDEKNDRISRLETTMAKMKKDKLHCDWRE